jgi:hypothetical protein
MADLSLSSSPRYWWHCAVCDAPMEWHDGVIELVDARSTDMPSYDPDAPEQMEALNDDGSVDPETTAAIQAEAAIRSLDDPGVLIPAHHWRADAVLPGRDKPGGCTFAA